MNSKYPFEELYQRKKYESWNAMNWKNFNR